MAVKIVETTDTLLLAKLNKDVQDLHHNIEPEIFKPYSEENRKKVFDKSLTNENTTAYIALYDELPAAYVLISKVDRAETFSNYGYSLINIEHICVDGKYIGKGIGKLLIDFVKKYAKENNINRLEMGFWSKNSNSGEFFRSQGFENYSERMSCSL